MTASIFPENKVIVPFSAFVGSADFTAADAIQAEFGGDQPSIDAQIGAINIVGGATANLTVATPEPSTSAGFATALASLAFALALRRKRRGCVL